MKNEQIKDMMRDIDPQFQQKADERAAAAAQHPRRRMAVPLILGAAAAGCAAFAAVIWLPSRGTQPLTPPAAAQSSAPEIEEIPAAAEIPITDFSEDEIRFMAPAYAPYILDIPAEQQQELASALMSSDWIPCGTDTPVPDGESYAVYVYNHGAPYRLTQFGDGSVMLEKDGASSRWMISDEASRAVALAANPEQTEGHLTWCSLDSHDPETIWDNTRVGAKECDMTDKRDVFFKMNNTPDYFDRCSGIVKRGDAGSMSEYEFQVDLNMGLAYQHEENYYGPSAEALISHGEGVTDAHFSVTEAMDGEYQYVTSDLSSGTWTKYPDSAHRIDSPTVAFEDLHPTGREGDEYDDWNSRSQILRGISVDCIENYRMAIDYLQDFDNWEITGTTEINGRNCVRIQGTIQFPYYDNAHSFELCIDEATGVTVRMYEYDADGGIWRFIVVEDLAFDDEAEPVTELDPEIRAGADTVSAVYAAGEPVPEAPEEAPASAPVTEPGIN